MPQQPPSPDLEAVLTSGFERTSTAAAQLTGYPHWDKVRRTAFPPGVTPLAVWTLASLSRQASRRVLPLQQANGEPFWYGLPDPLLAALQRIASEASGHLDGPRLVTDPGTRDRYIVRSLMEEAITSSQLEGASTTHRVAKELLRTQRPPRDVSERMIVNNYRAMRWVQDHVHEPITPARLCELHAIVTESTLSDPTQAGRVQRSDEPRVAVWSNSEDLRVHQPPPASELPRRIEALCTFAHADEPWMPLLLRAIICHFMVGYDHYFADGNGRLARALFYWVALREGAWLLEFTPISRILNRAPSAYVRAYLETETDHGDITYFALHQATVIERSISDLKRYLAEKSASQEAVRFRLREYDLNHREQAIAEGLLRDPTRVITVRSHAESHGVTLPTARADLRHLCSMGLLVSAGRRGRAEAWGAGPQLR